VHEIKGFEDQLNQNMRINKDCICFDWPENVDEFGITRPHRCFCQVNVQLWDDFTQKNRDFPDEEHLIAQGLKNSNNDHLDAKEKIHDWDARGLGSDFRDRCVHMNGKNYALYLKAKPDLEPPNIKKFEWLMKKLGCAADVAMKIITAARELSMGWVELAKIFPEIKKFNREHNACMIAERQEHIMREKTIAERADYLEMLAMETAEPDWKMQATWSEIHQQGPKIDGWEYMTDEVVAALKYVPYTELECEDPFWSYLEEGEEPFKEDEMDYGGDNNPFSAFPLYDGSEGVDHEFINEIKEMNMTELIELQRDMYPQKDHLNGGTRPARFWYITKSQKDIIWSYINERKEKIKQEAADNLSRDCQEVLRMINNWGKCSTSVSLIGKFKTGDDFKFYGEIISFDAPATPEELAVAWTVYKRL
jgi:hypothetical protein